MLKIAILLITATLLVSCTKQSDSESASSESAETTGASKKATFADMDKAQKIAHCKKEVLDWAMAHGIDEADVGEVGVQLSKGYFDGSSTELVAKLDFSAFDSEVPTAYMKMLGNSGLFKYQEDPGASASLEYVDLDKL